MTTLPRLDAFEDLERVLAEVTNYETELPRGDTKKAFDLARPVELVRRCGSPDKAYVTAHVAGTKGKGSTSATIAALGRAAGRKTGLYSSPHLIHLRERIRIEGAVASEAIWVAASRKVVPHALAMRDEGNPPTFFEITTAIALEAFRAEGVDLAVLETGLGGRLDATTIVTPAVSVVTQIGLDHTSLLGRTKEAIAAEKAAIAKPGVPLVSGVREPGPAEVVERFARERGAPLERLGHELDVAVEDVSLEGTTFTATTPRARREHARTALRGAHQAENAALAIAAFEHLQKAAVPDEVIRRGLASVVWRGRLDLVRREGEVPFLIDAAHDPTSAARLVEAVTALWKRRPRVLLLMAIAADKEVELVLDALSPLPVEAIVTRANTRRAADPHVLARGLASRGVRTLVAEPSAAAFAQARDRARDLKADVVLVAGSVYLAGEALGWLGEGAG